MASNCLTSSCVTNRDRRQTTANLGIVQKRREKVSGYSPKLPEFNGNQSENKQTEMHATIMVRPHIAWSEACMPKCIQIVHTVDPQDIGIKQLFWFSQNSRMSYFQDQYALFDFGDTVGYPGIPLVMTVAPPTLVWKPEACNALLLKAHR